MRAKEGGGFAQIRDFVGSATLDGAVFTVCCWARPFWFHSSNVEDDGRVYDVSSFSVARTRPMEDAHMDWLCKQLSEGQNCTEFPHGLNFFKLILQLQPLFFFNTRLGFVRT